MKYLFILTTLTVDDGLANDTFLELTLFMAKSYL